GCRVAVVTDDGTRPLEDGQDLLGRQGQAKLVSRLTDQKRGAGRERRGQRGAALERQAAVQRISRNLDARCPEIEPTSTLGDGGDAVLGLVVDDPPKCLGNRGDAGDAGTVGSHLEGDQPGMRGDARCVVAAADDDAGYGGTVADRVEGVAVAVPEVRAENHAP